jgi:hypothetical protein
MATTEHLGATVSYGEGLRVWNKFDYPHSYLVRREGVPEDKMVLSHNAKTRVDLQIVIPTKVERFTGSPTQPMPIIVVKPLRSQSTTLPERFQRRVNTIATKNVGYDYDEIAKFHDEIDQKVAESKRTRHTILTADYTGALIGQQLAREGKLTPIETLIQAEKAHQYALSQYPMEYHQEVIS